MQDFEVDGKKIGLWSILKLKIFQKVHAEINTDIIRLKLFIQWMLSALFLLPGK